MEEELLKELASQLRTPHGEMGKEVGEKMNESNRLINQFAIEALEVTDNDHVLEIGMGNGYFAKDILSRAANIRYSGGDISPLMIEEARRLNKISVEKGKAEFLLFDGKLLPWKDKAFQKMITVNTIYFWEDVPGMLKEIYRVLCPGGKLVIGLREKKIMAQYPFTKYGFNMFSENDLNTLLTGNGFQVEDIRNEEEPDQELGEEILKLRTLLFIARKQ